MTLRVLKLKQKTTVDVRESITTGHTCCSFS